MDRALIVPMLIYIIAHISDFVGHSESRHGIMLAAMDGGHAVSIGAGKHVNSVQGHRMQLHKEALAESEWLLFLFYKRSDYIESEFCLADAIFSLAARLFLGVAYQIDLLSRRMAPLGHCQLSAGRDFAVNVSDQLPRNSLILDVGIAIGKASALLGGLIGRHLDFARPFNEFFQFLRHSSSPRFQARY